MVSLPILSAKELSRVQRVYNFKYLVNSSVQERILDKLQLESHYDFKYTKVLDMFPGPAQFATVFINRYKPFQYTLMEDRPAFVKFIKEQYNDQMHLLQDDPYKWSSFLKIIDENKQFVPETQGRDRIHDRFLVHANLTNPQYEALVMQWLACIGNRNWIHRFGRVKMLLWVPTKVAYKLLAAPGSTARSKCSLVTEAFSDSRIVAMSDDSKTNKLFDPERLEKDDPIYFSEKDLLSVRKPVQSEFKGEEDTGRRNTPVTLLEIDPLDHNTDLENWDFVTRHLMILKKTPLREALNSLGHGALEFYLLKLEGTPHEALLDEYPQRFTKDDFHLITRIFYEWPFKPDINLDFIDILQEESHQ